MDVDLRSAGLSLAIISLVAVVLNTFVKRWGSDHDVHPFPPGPKPKPVIGNMFDFPTVEPAIHYVDWGKKYNSDILYARTLGTQIVVLNSVADAEELLERRSTNYSDRLSMTILKLMGWNRNILTMPYGEEWRIHRKVCQQSFRQEMVAKYHPIQIRKICAMLRGVLQTPEKFYDHSTMASIAIPMASIYGYDVESLDDPLVHIADTSIEKGLKLLTPAFSFLCSMPYIGKVVTCLPGIKARAQEVRRLSDILTTQPMEFAEKRFMEGTPADPSLASDFFERKNTVGCSQEEEKVISNVGFTVYSAASDTTNNAVQTFLYLMVAHPDVQKVAQAEIDRVIGERLPNFDDRPSLPYIDAIYREILRWHPPGPLGMPHSASEDDHYKGYLIPKGAMVNANIWAMTHDERIYPEPYTFKPERFLDGNGNLTDDDRVLAYGFGRRVCAGKYVASSTLWITFVSLLACFSFGKAKDEFGNDVEVEGDYEDMGVLSSKKPIKFSIRARSEVYRKLIEETATAE